MRLSRVWLLPAVAALLALSALALRRNDGPVPARPAASAPKKTPTKAALRETLLRKFREESRRDPTLAPAMLCVTEEDVRNLARLTPEEKRELWSRVQRFQAEARASGITPVFEESGGE